MAIKSDMNIHIYFYAYERSAMLPAPPGLPFALPTFSSRRRLLHQLPFKTLKSTKKRHKHTHTHTHTHTIPLHFAFLAQFLSVTIAHLERHAFINLLLLSSSCPKLSDSFYLLVPPKHPWSSTCSGGHRP